jgi:hypothetical protein
VALGVHYVLGDPFPIEVGHLLEQIVILEEQGTLNPCGERKLITRCPNSRISGRLRYWGVTFHGG